MNIEIQKNQIFQEIKLADSTSKIFIPNTLFSQVSFSGDWA